MQFGVYCTLVALGQIERMGFDDGREEGIKVSGIKVEEFFQIYC